MRFGKSGKLDRYGAITPIPGDAISQDGVLTYDSFAGGYDARDNREDTQRNSSPYALDTEVDSKDRITRGPGTSLMEVLANPATQLGLHASLSNRAELIMFAPPFFGYRGPGLTNWIDAGLPSGRPYAWTNFGGTLIFSNGKGGVYARQAGDNSIETLAEAPAARAYASFAARAVAGYAVIEGNYEPLGVRWSAANSDYADWTGTGSGFELLINDMSAGDKIMAMRTMGLDFMAIAMRRSLWVGRRTGLALRPIDFQPRVPGIGTVSAETCRATPLGMIFLSDTGVYIFDGNTATMVSAQINPDLLPLEYNRLEEYSGSYDPIQKRYHLMTPTGTWILDFDYQRWYRRSVIARGMVPFAEQFSSQTWGMLVGDWAGQAPLTWADYAPEEGELAAPVYLGSRGVDMAIEEEDYDSEVVFNLPMTPVWELPLTESQRANYLNTLKMIMVQHVGAGTLRLATTNIEGQYELLVEEQLLNASYPNLVEIHVIDTGKGVGLRIEYGTGKPKISRIQLVALPRGPRIASPPFFPREFYQDF